MENDKTVAGLAAHIGVPRQRIYDLIKRGFIRPKKGRRMIIPAAQVILVVDAVVRIETEKGTRVRFDWV